MYRLIFILILVLAGCTTEKKVVRYVGKNPDFLDRYKTIDTLETIRDTIIYRDTTVFDTIPGEYRIDSVKIPCPKAKIKPIELKLSYVTARSWLSNGKLYLDVDMPPMALKIHLDSAIVERNYYRELYFQEYFKPPPEKKVPKWVWVIVGIALVEFVLLALTLLLRR